MTTETPAQFQDVTLNPDLRISSQSVFSDDVWHFDVTLPGKAQSRIFWAVELADGSALTDSKHRTWLNAAKVFIYRYMQGEAGLDRELRIATIVNKYLNLRRFMNWMSSHDLFGFSALTDQHIISYRNSIRARRALKRGRGGGSVRTARTLSTASKRTALVLVKQLIALQHSIPDGPRCDRNVVFDALAADTGNFAQRREGSTPRIPDNIFCDLMSAALYWIREVGPPLLQRDAEFIEFRSSESWTAYKRYSSLAESHRDDTVVCVGNVSYDISALTRNQQLAWLNHLGAACIIVVAGLTGIRISEVLSLTRDCMSVVPIDRDRSLLLISGTVFKTSRKKEGEPTSWVAGWDEPTNPVRQAIELLDALHGRHGDADPSVPLFSPILEKQCGRRSGRPEFSSSALGIKANRFAALNGIDGWQFAAHQFRKTFARFVTVVAPNAILALQRHFKHVSLQMTERYISIDADLIDEIIEESLVLQEERLLAIVTSDRLGGIKGEEIMARNAQFRGAESRESAMDLVRLTMLDPSVHIVLHAYGACFYEESKAKCAGSTINVGLSTCQGCSNFAVDPSHLPFWKQQRDALDGALSEVASIGMTSAVLQKQRTEADEMVKRLENGRP